MRRALAIVALCSACGRLGFGARAGADASDGMGDTALPGDTASATTCSATSMVADTFDAAAMDPKWYPYANGGITLAQQGGELVITLPATTGNTGAYGGYESAWSYDLRGSHAYVEVTQSESVATSAQTNFHVVGVSGDNLEITEENGMLTAKLVVGGTGGPIASVPYDPVQHRWWQIREDAGTTYCETSPDGTTFTAFATAPTPAFAALVNVGLEAGSYQVETAPGATHFDNLDGGTPVGAWCTASTLRDDFSSGTLADLWGASYTSGGCSYAVGGGDANVTLTSAGVEDCGFVSAMGFDLSSDAVFTELTTTPNQAVQTYSYLRASTPNGDNVELAVVSSTLECGQNIGTAYSTSCGVPYDPVNHKFLRLLGSGTTLTWQASPDAATWTTIHTGPSPIGLVGVNLSIGAGTNAAVASPGSAAFATFDQLPP